MRWLIKLEVRHGEWVITWYLPWLLLFVFFKLVRLSNHFVLACSNLHCAWMLLFKLSLVILSISFRPICFLHSFEWIINLLSASRVCCWAQDPHQLPLHLFLLCLFLELLSPTVIVVKACACHSCSSISPSRLSLLLNYSFNLFHLFTSLKRHQALPLWRWSSRKGLSVVEIILRLFLNHVIYSEVISWSQHAIHVIMWLLFFNW